MMTSHTLAPMQPLPYGIEPLGVTALHRCQRPIKQARDICIAASSGRIIRRGGGTEATEGGSTNVLRRLLLCTHDMADSRKLGTPPNTPKQQPHQAMPSDLTVRMNPLRGRAMGHEGGRHGGGRTNIQERPGKPEYATRSYRMPQHEITSSDSLPPRHLHMPQHVKVPRG